MFVIAKVFILPFFFVALASWRLGLLLRLYLFFIPWPFGLFHLLRLSNGWLFFVTFFYYICIEVLLNSWDARLWPLRAAFLRSILVHIVLFCICFLGRFLQLLIALLLTCNVFDFVSTLLFLRLLSLDLLRGSNGRRNVHFTNTPLLRKAFVSQQLLLELLKRSLPTSKLVESHLERFKGLDLLLICLLKAFPKICSLKNRSFAVLQFPNRLHQIVVEIPVAFLKVIAIGGTLKIIS